jgi:hypothetical protein
MCMGGGGKSAEDYYNEMKIEPEPLPSLTVDPVERAGSTYRGVRPGSRTGAQRRSLLTMGMLNAQ